MRWLGGLAATWLLTAPMSATRVAAQEGACPSHIILTEVSHPVPLFYARGTRTLRNPDDFEFMAAVLAAHTEYTLIELVPRLAVEEPGGAALGTARAEAVLEAMVARGVARERLMVGTPRLGRLRNTSEDESSVRFEVRASDAPRAPLCHHPFPGCSASDANASSILERVYFEARSAALSDAVPMLDAVALTLLESPSLRDVRVVGHRTSDEAPTLARARVEVVIARLISLGIDRARLVLVDGGVDPEATRPELTRVVRFEVPRPPTCRPQPPR